VNTIPAAAATCSCCPARSWTPSPAPGETAGPRLGCPPPPRRRLPGPRLWLRSAPLRGGCRGRRRPRPGRRRAAGTTRHGQEVTPGDRIGTNYLQLPVNAPRSRSTATTKVAKCAAGTTARSRPATVRAAPCPPATPRSGTAPVRTGHCLPPGGLTSADQILQEISRLAARRVELLTEIACRPRLSSMAASKARRVTISLVIIYRGSQGCLQRLMPQMSLRLPVPEGPGPRHSTRGPACRAGASAS
jgi:hypothetical protein